MNLTFFFFSYGFLTFANGHFSLIKNNCQVMDHVFSKCYNGLKFTNETMFWPIHAIKKNHFHIRFCPNQFLSSILEMGSISVMSHLEQELTNYRIMSGTNYCMCFIYCWKGLLWVWISFCKTFIDIVKATMDILPQTLEIKETRTCEVYSITKIVSVTQYVCFVCLNGFKR